jgi:AIG2-like family
MMTMRVMVPSPGPRDVPGPLSPLPPAAVGTGPGATLVTLGGMGLYAAYGSNMDPEQMLRRCPSSPHTGTGWIRGWRLTFGAEEYGWDGALATLVPTDDDAPGVFVALYDLTDADERNLDAWEGADHGLYRKLHLRAHTLAGDVVAYVYVLDAFEGGLPSARHLGAIADGAEAAGAPTDYVVGLRSRECRSTGL